MGDRADPGASAPEQAADHDEELSNFFKALDELCPDSCENEEEHILLTGATQKHTPLTGAVSSVATCSRIVTRVQQHSEASCSPDRQESPQVSSAQIPSAHVPRLQDEPTCGEQATAEIPGDKEGHFVEEKLLPPLPDAHIATLRALTCCPLCMDDTFMDLMSNKKRRRTKKAPRKSAITGRVRHLHVRQCMYIRRVDVNTTVNAISRERDNIDRQRRKAFAEQLNDESIWKSVTGVAPPSTQVQNAALQGNDVSESSTSKGKSPRRLPARQGGTRRESTLIELPQHTWEGTKERCIDLFGPLTDPFFNMSSGSSRAFQSILQLYDFAYAESAIEVDRRRGLGVGACCPILYDMGTDGRLGMGSILAFHIAKVAMKDQDGDR